MRDYRDFQPEELAADTSFQRWKLFKDPIEEAFWEEWLTHNPDKQEVVDKAYYLLITLNNVYQQSVSEGFYISKQEVKQEINRLEQAISHPVQHDRRASWFHFTPVRYGMAASLLVLLGLFGWYLVRQNNSVKQEVTYAELIDHAVSTLSEVNNTGSKPMLVRLPDRSTVLLSPKSRVSYSKQFSGSKREVYLSGEAFFSVVKNPAKPFYVYSNRLVTKVLGTSFVVQAYEEANQAKVIVVTGKVSVYTQSRETITNPTGATQEKGVVLMPNQQLVFSPKEASLIKSVVEQPALLNHTPDKQLFTFKRTPIADVFATLEQAYGIKIIFDEELMRHCYLTAALSDEPLYDKLTLIGHTIDATFEQLDGCILIHSQGCKQ
jgi:ferric-dicitrate binding protein FerR (iron transport regulator)